jgi:hypothetical protein
MDLALHGLYHAMFVQATDPDCLVYSYEKPEDWSIVQVPLPELRDNDVLIKVKACGVCGTGRSSPTL